MNQSISPPMMHPFKQRKILPQCPGRRFQLRWLVGRLSARLLPQKAPRRQTPATGPMSGKASHSGPVVHTHPLSLLTVSTNIHAFCACKHTHGPTSVTWLCVEKKTRANGSERPLLSAANRLRAWYMCALSWNTCFTVGHTHTHTHTHTNCINWWSIPFVAILCWS